MWFLCHCSGLIQWEVNHLCFPPSHHLLVVDDGIVWLTAGVANERNDSYRCGVDDQSWSGEGAGLASMGREPSGGSSSRSDSSGVGSSATLRKRSRGYDDYNGGKWKLGLLGLKSPSAEIRTGRKHVKMLWSQLQISAIIHGEVRGIFVLSDGLKDEIRRTRVKVAFRLAQLAISFCTRMLFRSSEYRIKSTDSFKRGRVQEFVAKHNVALSLKSSFLTTVLVMYAALIIAKLAG